MIKQLKDTTLTFRVDGETFDRLMSLLDEDIDSTSAIARKALRAGIKVLERQLLNKERGSYEEGSASMTSTLQPRI
jgi:predicted transcriptional regulator